MSTAKFFRSCGRDRECCAKLFKVLVAIKWKNVDQRRTHVLMAPKFSFEYIPLNFKYFFSDAKYSTIRGFL